MGINFRMNDTETAYEKCDLSHIACGGNTDEGFQNSRSQVFLQSSCSNKFLNL